MFNTFKAQLVPIEMHEGPIGRHYGIETIVNKLLNYGYWWPTMQKETTQLCQSCEICQWLGPLNSTTKGLYKKKIF
jgi:hypothetical protein